MLIKHFHGVQLTIGKLTVFRSHKKFIAYDKSIRAILANRSHETQEKSSRGYLHQDSQQDNVFKDKSASFSNFVNDSDEFENRHTFKSKRDVKDQNDSNLALNNKRVNQFNNDEHSLKATNKFKKNSQESYKTQTSHDVEPTHDSYTRRNNNGTKILRIDGPVVSHVSHQIFLNIFGCFGNIDRMMINNSTQSCIMQFETPLQAKYVLQYLNNIKFFGHPLRITYLADSSILDEAVTSSDPDIHFVKGHYKYFRYKFNLNIKINKPAKLLHFTK